MASAGVAGRIWFVLSLLWMVSAIVTLWIFNPFGYYWYQAAWLKAITIVVDPVIVTGIGVLLVPWAIRTR